MMEKTHSITEDDMWDYLEDWELFDSDGSGERTRISAKEAFRKFCRYLDEDLDKHYSEVTEDEMNKWIKLLLKNGLSHLVVGNLHTSVNQFLLSQDIEVADDLEAVDKLDDQTIAQQNLPDGIHYLEVEEHKQMLDACESLREKIICECLWSTGVRRSELASIKIGHITPEDNEIWIDTAKNDTTRHVYYGPRFANLLEKWLNYGRQQYAYADESDYLICTSHSPNIADKYPNEVVKRVADRAGLLSSYETDAAGRKLHHPTAHSYRHSFAVHRLSMNLKPLSDLLGHKSTETTAEAYLHLRDKDLRDQNEKHRPKF